MIPISVILLLLSLMSTSLPIPDSANETAFDEKESENNNIMSDKPFEPSEDTKDTDLIDSPVIKRRKAKPSKRVFTELPSDQTRVRPNGSQASMFEFEGLHGSQSGHSDFVMIVILLVIGAAIFFLFFFVIIWCLCTKNESKDNVADMIRDRKGSHSPGKRDKARLTPEEMKGRFGDIDSDLRLDMKVASLSHMPKVDKKKKKKKVGDIKVVKSPVKEAKDGHKKHKKSKHKSSDPKGKQKVAKDNKLEPKKTPKDKKSSHLKAMKGVFSVTNRD